MAAFSQNVMQACGNGQWTHVGCAEAIGVDLGTSLLGALVVVLVAHLLLRGLRIVIDRLVQETIDSGFRGVSNTRASTIQGLLHSVARYTIDFLAIITILTIWGVPTQGILAGAGIAGLAIGFGAQNLVRDVITGFFLIFEDQFRVGEYVEAAGVFGPVEDIGFRVTKIRDWGGQLHTIPNGLFDKMTNYSRGDMRVMISVRVSYEEDVERVEQLLSDVCADFAKSWASMTNGPMVLGVNEMGDQGMEYLLWGQAEANTQWAAQRALRKEVKKALDAAGVRAPFPHRIISQRTPATPPLPPGVAIVEAGTPSATADGDDKTGASSGQGAAPDGDNAALRRMAERAAKGQAGPVAAGEAPPEQGDFDRTDSDTTGQPSPDGRSGGRS